MYQALYRKWRSRTFSEMVGQESVIRTLRNQVASGRIAHAYLFCGSHGTGKTSAAKIMARAINCEHPVNGDPCLECESCRALMDDASLDVFEMDAASNSRVEEIRDLLEKVDYPPQFSRYKVYIIDEVHMLSNAAFNALLKTLEEPPSYMVFILATTEPQKIPSTILSRCQRFDFGRLTEEQMISRMTTAMPELKDAEPAALMLIARSADGAMRDAWSLLDMCLGSGEKLTEQLVREALGAADSDFLFDFAAALAAADGTRALNMIDDLMLKGRDVQVFLRDFAAHVRQLASFKLGARAAGEMTGQNARRYEEQSREISLPRLLRMLEMAMRSEADTRYASSPRAVLELFALRACRVADSADVEGLSAQVEDLTHRLEQLQKNGVIIQKTEAPAPKPAVSKTPAAAPVSAAPTETETPEGRRPADVWNAALKRLAREAVAAYALISQGKFGGFSQGVYHLVFNRDAAMSRDFVNAPERKAVMERLLTEEGGAPAQFEAVLEGDGRREKSLREQQERDEKMLIDTLGRERVQIDND
ncbi:MAG: DNA polymerase III subunit gamma/tau [Clostridia bacterium]|nr:DNA polymerase III subunit gamma/tau [Clostridia bacterium]